MSIPWWRSPDWFALVRSVAANPKHNLPRLVAADWLDEWGGPGREAAAYRAELIRAQCERDNRAAWFSQIAGNSFILPEVWGGHLAGPAADILIDRGFMTGVAFQVYRFRRNEVAGVLAAEPIRRVELFGSRPVPYSALLRHQPGPVVRYGWDEPGPELDDGTFDLDGGPKAWTEWLYRDGGPPETLAAAAKRQLKAGTLMQNIYHGNRGLVPQPAWYGFTTGRAIRANSGTGHATAEAALIALDRAAYRTARNWTLSVYARLKGAGKGIGLEPIRTLPDRARFRLDLGFQHTRFADGLETEAASGGTGGPTEEAGG